MQTDAENRPEVQRDFDEDIRLTTEVKGIDVFVGGHAHRGIEEPYVNSKNRNNYCPNLWLRHEARLPQSKK